MNIPENIDIQCTVTVEHPPSLFEKMLELSGYALWVMFIVYLLT